MNVNEALREIRRLGVRVSRQEGEFRVSLPTDPAAAYYTADAVDSVGTARAMVAVRDRLLRDCRAAGVAGLIHGEG